MSESEVRHHNPLEKSLAPLRNALAKLDDVPRSELSLDTLVGVQKALLWPGHPFRGQLREGPGVIRQRGKVVYQLPAPSDARAMAEEAIGWLATGKFDGSVRPHTLATHVILALLRAHPFQDGNGRVARAVGTWILLGAGYDLLLDPRIYCKIYGDQYYSSLSTQPDVHLPVSSGPWHDFCLGMIFRCFRPPVELWTTGNQSRTK